MTSILYIYSITIIINARMVQVQEVHDVIINTTTTLTTANTTPQPQLVPDSPEAHSNFSLELVDLDWDVFCKFQPNGHSCFEDNVSQPAYYYDTRMGDCRTFHYGGCRNSKNVFHSLKECQKVCREAGPSLVVHAFDPVIFCRFQPNIGNCDEYIPMFTFDLSTKKCIGFAFTGCGGNQNRFMNAHDCATTCVPVVKYAQSRPYDY